MWQALYLSIILQGRRKPQHFEMIFRLMFWWKIPVLSMQRNTFCAILAKFLKTQEGKQQLFILSPFLPVAATSKLSSTPFLFSSSFLNSLVYFCTYNKLEKNIIAEGNLSLK